MFEGGGGLTSMAALDEFLNLFLHPRPVVEFTDSPGRFLVFRVC